MSNICTDTKKSKKELKKLEKLEKFQNKKITFKIETKIQAKKTDEKVYYNLDTKKGEKKDVLTMFPDKYHPTYVEHAWYDWWVDQGFFKPEFKFHLSSMRSKCFNGCENNKCNCDMRSCTINNINNNCDMRSNNINNLNNCDMRTDIINNNSNNDKCDMRNDNKITNNCNNNINMRSDNIFIKCNYDMRSINKLCDKLNNDLNMRSENINNNNFDMRNIDNLYDKLNTDTDMRINNSNNNSDMRSTNLTFNNNDMRTTNLTINNSNMRNSNLDNCNNDMRDINLTNNNSDMRSSNLDDTNNMRTMNLTHDNADMRDINLDNCNNDMRDINLTKNNSDMRTSNLDDTNNMRTTNLINDNTDMRSSNINSLANDKTDMRDNNLNNNLTNNEININNNNLNNNKYKINENKFIMILPPPNVTGTLHLGHALMCAIQDALMRYQRMRGKMAVWIPGVDHAGIATQVVVEKQLMRLRGLSRHQIGRQNFIDEVYKWKAEKGHIINDQLKRMAISADWSREFFTMDPKRSEAVTHAFIKLHNNNKIYRKFKLINWSCALNSAISDIEVDKVEIKNSTFLKIPNYINKVEFGVLIYFKYKIVNNINNNNLNNSDIYITVATTRIETMLGDVAIAVNPLDDKYRELIGLTTQHPFCNRLIPIIADESVDINFGTGAVKITPAHDPADYEIGQKHNLKFINIFNDNGCVLETLDFFENFKFFGGMPRFEARVKILEHLTNLNLFVKKVNHSYIIPICSRSGDVVEPMLKSQWFIDCGDLARRAAEAVKNGALQIIPKNHEKTWFKFMDNIQDWCISRQLWWGHRIPAFFVTSPKLPESSRDDGYYWVSGIDEKNAREIAAKKYRIPPSELTLSHDEDVLDTWFSSGLLPLSACDWPNSSLNFDNFFPSTVLETGYDILFFWAARMVMLSLELENKLPFKTILLHSIVRDSHGRKMSKSLGNIIDPIDVIQGISLEALHEKLLTYNLDKAELEKARKGQTVDFKDGIPECGSDALRFTLSSYSGSKKDINLDVLRVRGYRAFCNKIWNAVRFCLSNISNNKNISDKNNYIYSTISFNNFYSINNNFNNLTLIDKWILSRLSLTSQQFNTAMNEFDLSQATSVIYQFWLYNFCDIYIESLKPIFRGSDETLIHNSRNVMFYCIDNALRMLHPFMPFITEELYQRLPFDPDHFTSTPSICVSDFPKDLPFYDANLEKEIDMILSTVNLIRSTKDDYVPSQTKIPIYIHVHSEHFINIFCQFKQLFSVLCNASELEINSDISNIPQGCVVAPNGIVCDIHLKIKGIIDLDSEINKNKIKLKTAEDQYKKLKDITNEPDYIKKVPTDVQETHTTKLLNFEAEIKKLQSIIECLNVAK